MHNWIVVVTESPLHVIVTLYRKGEQKLNKEKYKRMNERVNE